MPNREWRNKAELETLVLEKLRGFRGCEGAFAVTVEPVHDPRSAATWKVAHVAGTDTPGIYDEVLAGVLPAWQEQYGLLLPTG